MRIKTMALILAFTATACSSEETPGDDPKAQIQAAFIGHWRAECAPADATSWGVSEFVAGPDQRGSFTYTSYGDADCTVPLASFTIEDEQYIGDPVPDVGEDVWELDLPYISLSATAYVPDLLTVFEQSGCGEGPYEVGEPIDISATGCLFFKPIDACPGDYDIMTIDGDAYRNGVRETDMCTPVGRPGKLNDFAFYRVED